ncbi:MAG TPA: Omp28-related outer membrane protein [Bacteroidia bacterium]|nr:Omp28-related outer membrane protein [Bacteroidia bacterium]
MNKKILSLALAAFAVSVLFFACDEVDPPYTIPDNTNTANDSSCIFDAAGPATYRKVLVEDYTGHLCGNCPYAAGVIANTLHPLYGDTLIAVGVHASPFSQFTETCPPALYPPGAAAFAPVYTEDFRTVAGEAWLSFFAVPNNPKGMVSRIDYPTTHVKSPTAWAAATASIIGQPADVGIQIINTYNSSTGNLTVCIKTTYLAAFSGTYYLSVLLLEDSIHAWQEDYTIDPPSGVPPLYQNDTNYIHRHVMRGAINSEFGVQLNTAPVAAGDTVRNSYIINLLSLPASMNTTNPAVNVARCSVVAFVYNNTTKEILQAEEAEVE